MTPGSQIHAATTIISEGAYLLEHTIEHGGYLHPDGFSNTDMLRTEKRLRDLADQIGAARLKLVGNAPDNGSMYELVRELQAAE